MRFLIFALASCFFATSLSAEIPLGRKYPPDLILQEGNPLMIPPDFDVMLPEPGLEVITEEERDAYKKEVLSVIFPDVDLSNLEEADKAKELDQDAVEIQNPSD